MTTQLGCKTNADKQINYLETYLCFLAFGLLVGFAKENILVLSVLFSMLISGAFALMLTRVLVMVFEMVNPELCKENPDFAARVTKQGMLFLIPFTVLGIIAKLILGWDTIMPFASAGIMTAAGTAGMEAVKGGAKGLKNSIYPMILGFVISTLWMLIVNILP